MGLFTTGLDTENPPDEQLRKEYLEKAIDAAKAGDLRTALEALYLGHILDGLYRRLRKKWGKHSDDEIHDALAQALVQLLEKVVEGEQVLSPVAYLIKVSDGIASNAWKHNKRYSDVEIDRLRSPEINSNETPDDVDTNEITKQALTIARSFLPRLGQENVQSVMEYIFDAVERGVEDVSNQEIGDALSLSQAVVRQSKVRGWQRLERVAEESGYHINVTFLKESIEGQEGDDNE